MYTDALLTVLFENNLCVILVDGLPLVFCLSSGISWVQADRFGSTVRGFENILSVVSILHTRGRYTQKYRYQRVRMTFLLSPLHPLLRTTSELRL